MLRTLPTTEILIPSFPDDDDDDDDDDGDDDDGDDDDDDIAQPCEIFSLFLPAPSPLGIPPSTLTFPASRRLSAPITLPGSHPLHTKGELDKIIQTKRISLNIFTSTFAT